MNAIRIFSILTLLFAAVGIYGQNFIAGYGSSNFDEAVAVDKDNNGNLYTTGYFNGQAMFGPIQVASEGLSDVFVTKTSGTPPHPVEWVFTGGGTGPDRGLDIVVANDGSSCISGFYSSSINFEGVVLNSTANSQDFFVLKISPDGDVEWARSFGGELGDSGFGIDFDSNNNVLITGQFRGTIDFDGTEFTSIQQFGEDELSFDTFVLKLDALGNVAWAKHGQNDFESKGWSVKTDVDNNVFVCGQFSDTLTFDVEHPNDVFSAAFIVKFDPDGNEQWFRRIASSQTNAYDLDISSTGDVYITGDNLGGITVFGDDLPQTFDVDYDHNIYVAKFSNGGNLEWLSTNGSYSPVSSRAIALDENNEPYITGHFRCRFEEYSLDYGPGIYYSAGFRDIFITKFDGNGNRQWSRHCASTMDAQGWGITVIDTDNPVICGSYENRLVVTDAPTFSNAGGNAQSVMNPPQCGDDFYGNIRWISSFGNTDIFLAAPINLNREPLDYFLREMGCEYSYLPACVYFCEDTLEVCGPATVSVQDNTIGFPLNPLFNIEWTSSLGDVPLLQIPESGEYYWTYEREDGCESYSDSLTGIINPYPQPTITDDLGININSLNAAPISFCYPDTIALMGSNFDTNDVYDWSAGTDIIESNADSAIYVTNQGVYSFQIINEHGCVAANSIDVSGYYPIDSIIGDIFVPGVEPFDTISLCPGEDFNAYFEISPDSPADETLIIENSGISWGFIPNGEGEVEPQNPATTALVTAYESGHFIITFEIIPNCDTIVELYEFPVYIEILPEPEFNLQIEGADYLCPGDTATLYVTGADSDIEWNGENFIQISPDTIIAWEVGGYNVSSEVFNEFGCSNLQTQSYFLGEPSPIPISMQPANGIICPDDSVQLNIQPGASYEWYGPDGPIDNDSSTIWVTTPGIYYCVHTNDDGCSVESNTVEVQEYATPYLVPYPGNDICFEGEVEIVVVSNASGSIAWEPPISSNEQSVVVTEPGVYTCSVTLCGITTTLSINILETEVNSFIEIEGGNSLCSGDSLLLTGNAGMTGYEWYPGGEQTQSIWVTEPGEYLLYTYNELGCMGISDTLVFDEGPTVALEQSGPINFCSGDSVYLSADNSTFSTYLWTPTGDTIPQFYTTEPGTYQLTITDEFGCSATSEEIELNFYDTSEPPETNDQLICYGSDATLIIPGAENTTWILGENEIETDTLVLEALLSDTIIYYYLTDANGCHSSTDSILVEIVPNDYQPAIYGNEELCAGEAFSLQTDTVDNGFYSWVVDGNEISTSHEMTFSTSPDFSGVLNVILSVNIAGCTESEDTVSVSVLPQPDPLTIDGNRDYCVDEAVVLSTSLPTGVSPLWSWNDQSSSANSIELNSSAPGNYTVTITPELNGCWGSANQMQVTIHPYPEIVSVNSNTPVCSGSLLSVSAEVAGDDEITIITPIGGNFNSNIYEVITTDTSLTGLFTITANNGFCEDTENIWVDVYPSPQIELGGDQTHCVGQVTEFEINQYDSVNWNGQFSNAYHSVTETQLVFADVYNVYGCSASDSVMVTFEDCDGYISNVFTPNNDGSNDQFDFNPHNYLEWHVEIYNRWGQKVCSLQNYRYWDGINCSTGQLVSDGTYYYLMEYTTVDQRIGTHKGYIQVFR